ncbi:MAG: GNAT family N-acetyltransferase [Crocinitomicaceae bacterium]|nr:GNAT family N-acetyltransferase [Crocinitomicaceae bacterium]
MKEIDQLGTDDVFIVNHLAKQIWPDTFKDILSKGQIDYMLDWMYNINTLQEQVQTGHLYYLIKSEGMPVGFMGLEPNFPDAGYLRMHKIYVLPEMQGKGIGRALLNHAIDLCFDLDLVSIHLNVNRFNKAVGFYKKTGFNLIGEENIDIGKGYLMEDFIFELPLIKS